MPKPVVLYSATTRLAYWIGQQYFGGIHYVWCAPAPEQDRFAPGNPPSSDPLSLCRQYRRDIEAGDEHSALVEQNRRGLVRGAEVREQEGLIDGGTRALIGSIVQRATLRDFSPLLFVIPYGGVRSLVRQAAVADLAGATSQEFVIEKLPRQRFDVLDLRG